MSVQLDLFAPAQPGAWRRAAIRIAAQRQGGRGRWLGSWSVRYSEAHALAEAGRVAEADALGAALLREVRCG